MTNSIIKKVTIRSYQTSGRLNIETRDIRTSLPLSSVLQIFNNDRFPFKLVRNAKTT